jgi:hypothetical protein
MTLVLLVGVKRTEKNIGSLEILGEVIGDKVVMSDSSEVLIILVLNQLALGQPLLILGQKILEMKQNQNSKTLFQRNF